MSLVSVVMSAYNAEKYISQSIESILCQTLTDFEFIIINDGSTDGTKHILDYYSARDSRIKIISQNNKGLTKSLNIGVASTSSSIIARMDADDISHPRRLIEEYKFLSSNKDHVLVGCDYNIIGADGSNIESIKRPCDNDELQCALYVETPFAHGSVMYKKSSFYKAGEYKVESGSAEDYDLWCSLAKVGKIHIIPEVLFSWRKSNYSITTLRKSKVADDAYQVRKKINYNKPCIITKTNLINLSRRKLNPRDKFLLNSYGRIIVYQLKHRIPEGRKNLYTVLTSGRIGRYIITSRITDIIKNITT